MSLEGWKRGQSESLEDFFDRIAKDTEKKPPWSEEQQMCWDKFMDDLNKKDETEKKRYILKRAYGKDYHDFESEDIAKVELAEDLRKAGYLDMLNKLMHEKYNF